MTDDKEEKEMAIRQEDFKKHKKMIRNQAIRKLANKIADRNDEGLRRLSKD